MFLSSKCCFFGLCGGGLPPGGWRVTEGFFVFLSMEQVLF